MQRIKVFLIGLAVSFLAISIMCFILHQPLIFLPVRYNLANFAELLLLMAFLNLGLIMFSLEPLKWINQKYLHKNGVLLWLFYGSISLLILFIATLFFGSTETFLGGHMPDPFYYYTFSNNSWIYLVCGAGTVILISFLYAQESSKKIPVEK